ncbi:MAG: helix-turn-helix transcriptional regulator [Hyphomicrobiales bacterium]|nr:helix-turn-helix transcriptional regulator [Hyphomicrobiales bacterium]
MPKDYLPKRQPLDPCPVEQVLTMIGGKWKARTLYLLAHHVYGFAALRRELGAVSQQVLSTQLRALETDGLVSRSDGGDGAPVYAATAKGRDLVGLLTPVAEWGTRELASKGLVWSPPP